ncbi:MAG TPA: CopG family transcriptional regulator [Desulfobulbaceae bacterium]|nr:MAG: CopG family transcriptional regulator [Deltaproteobacteria bacterium RIFOXYD12_FULL_53_23]HCC54216.1 CopG family transcriptional regulator [Desulfobulbaceae bacterium]
MGQAKVAITMDEMLLSELDSLVQKQLFPNRSRAIQVAVAEKLQRLAKKRLVVELGKLEVVEEQALAEEGIGLERDAWPPY